jgi:hypothetical protein
VAPKRSTIFNAVEFGALAYGVYCSISAFIGGIFFCIMASVASSQVSSFNAQGGGQAQAPNFSGALVAIGVVLIIVGVIGFVVCAGLIAKRRAEGEYDALGIGRPTLHDHPGDRGDSEIPGATARHEPEP